MRRFISVITSVLLAVSVLFPAAGGITAFAEESGNLTLDEVVSLTPKSEGQISYRTFLFTPESTGAYKCRAFDDSGNTTGYVNVYTYTDGVYNYEQQDEIYQNNQTRFAAFYLQAGVEYQISVQFSKSCSFVITDCELVKDFSIFTDGSNVGSEYTAYAGLSSYMYCQRSNSTAYIGRLTYSFSDPEVAALSEQSNSVKFLKAGETDMTVSTVFGLTKTVHITVNEPPVLEYGTAAEVQNGSYAFSFTAPDDGLFGILADSPYGIIIMYIFHDNERVASYQRTVNGVMSQYEMKAGERYVISGQYSGPQSGKIEVIKPTKAESLSLVTTDGDYLTDFSCNAGTRIYAYTSFGPENAAFEDVRLISNSNEEVVKTEMYSANEVCFVSVKAGVAVLKFQSDNGLEVSVTVTVSEPVSLTEDQPLTVTYNAKYQGERAFSFTPAEDGDYVVKADNFSEFESGYINFRITDGTNTIGEAYCSGGQPAKLSAGNLQKNKTYTIFCNMRGYTNSVGLSDSSSFDLTVSKGVAVSSLELLTPPDIKCLYEGEQPGDFYGLSVRINYTDGSSDIWKYDEGIYEVGGFGINVSYSGPGYNEPYVTVSCSGKSVTFYYEVRECDITAIERIEYEELIYDASYSDNSFYRDIEGDCFRVTYKNGRVEYKALMQGEDYISYFLCDSATGLKEKVSISSSQTYSNDLRCWVWNIGTENCISVNYRGFECRIPVTVINAESLNITNIEPVNGAAIRFIENSHGYDDGSGSFIYNIYDNELSEIKVDITYGNGERTEKNIPLNKSYNGIGFNFREYEQQKEAPWLPGQDNYLKVSYGGFEFNIPVIIEKEGAFIKSAEVIEQPVYRYGDREHGSFDDGTYYFYPKMRDGFKIKLTYNDDNNTTVILDSSMLDSEGKINGKRIEFDFGYDGITGYSETVERILNYGTLNIPITLRLEKPVVAGLTVKNAPSVPKYGFMSPDFIGTEIEITYSDNNKKTVIFDNQNTYIDSDTGRVAVNTDDGTVFAEYISYCNSYQFTFRDAACVSKATGTPEYDADSVSGIEFVNETKNIIGSVVRISFNDGKATELTLSDAAGTFDTQGWAMALTDYGYMRFNRYGYRDNSLEFYCLQYSLKISSAAGDMNGDGSVDIMDMICLKKYFAGTAEICNRNADVTVDGSVSAEDMAELKKFLLGATRLTTKEGDMNCDGRFDKADLKLLSAYLAGNDIMLPKIADVNGDGVIDKNDFYALKQKYSEYTGY